MGDYEDRVVLQTGSETGSGNGMSEPAQASLPGFDWDSVPDEKRQRVEALDRWLDGMSAKERSETLRKAVEYGSSDLEVMGNAMVLLLPEHLRSRQIGLQMAVGFYALGKVARLFGAFEDGRSPSADTWYDLHIYALMGLKIQETGAWL